MFDVFSLYDLKTWFLLFIIYAFIGWIIEIIDVLIMSKKLVNRGFLIGPYCPIYGYGSICMIALLAKYKTDPIVLFVMSVLICSILEYLTSYIMEKLFKARWWDYSKNKFNINGRICLETMIPFGIGGCIIMYIVNPFIISCLNMLPNLLLTIVASILFIIFLVDNIVSFKIILNFKNVSLNLYKDSTEEITKKVREVLANKSKLGKRLMKAFPDLESKIKERIKKIKK